MPDAPPVAAVDPMSRAAQLHAAGQLANALAAYDRIVAQDPANADAFCNRGDVLADLGLMDLAIASYDRAIALNPAHGDAHDFRGIALAQAGRGPEALASFDRAVALNPGNVNAIGNRASMLLSLGRPTDALASFDRAIALRPDFTVAYINRANILVSLGRTQEAIASFDRAIALQPDLVDAHFNRGEALSKLGLYEAAAESYRRVIELEPGHGRALSKLAQAMAALGRPLDGVAYYGRVFAMQHEQTEARIRQRASLEELKQLEDQLEHRRQAAARAPDDALVVGDLGAALLNMGRLDEAVETLQRAIALNPGLAHVYRNLSLAFSFLGQVESAIEAYDKAVACDPRHDEIPGMRIIWALSLCRWHDLEPKSADIVARIEAGDAPTPPFTFLLLRDSLSLQRRCVQSFHDKYLAPRTAAPLAHRYPRRERIRIGYFSSDFHTHATMQLIAEMLEAHDKTRFEWFGFSFGGPSNDVWRRRAIAALDHFTEIGPSSDLEIVNHARNLQIDIAVDLKGATQGCRTGIFAQRAAPIQVNFLGYPGTMGDFFEYIVADRVLIPEAAKPFYSEKVVYLPGSYQPNCRHREISSYPATRRDFELPAVGVVYCCFNQSSKITPEVFASWMTILKCVEGSVLWLWVVQKATADNLRAAARSHGVDPERLVFAVALNVEEHLNRLRLADVFLDTLPYNAHTTGSDALRMGVPLVTCIGQSFAARVAASLLEAVGLPELITHTRQDYEALAIDLGRNPERLADTKAKLRRNVQTSSLFDGAGFARKLEQAFDRMYTLHQDGQPPRDLYL